MKVPLLFSLAFLASWQFLAQSDNAQVFAQNKADIMAVKSLLQQMQDKLKMYRATFNTIIQQRGPQQQNMSGLKGTITAFLSQVRSLGGTSQKIQEAQNAVSNIQNQINAREDQISQLKREIDATSWPKKALVATTNGAKIAALELEIGKLKLTAATASEALQLAQAGATYLGSTAIQSIGSSAQDTIAVFDQLSGSLADIDQPLNQLVSILDSISDRVGKIIPLLDQLIAKEDSVYAKLQSTKK